MNWALVSIGRRSRVFITAFAVFVSVNSAHSIDLKEWDTLNENYQVGYLSGLIGSIVSLGVPDYLDPAMDLSMKCLANKKWTYGQINGQFGRYLQRSSLPKNMPVPEAFMSFLFTDCQR